jgi:phosphatidylglycerophosphate synthase
MVGPDTGWRLPDQPLRGSVIATQLAALIVCSVLAVSAQAGLALSAWYPLEATAILAAVLISTLGFVQDRHPFVRFGPANAVTTVRASLVALAAGLLFGPVESSVAGGAVAAAMVSTTLDGVDGWLARRSSMSSEFGARFDMEIDALLGLVLSVLAWRHAKAGMWILLAGLFRYLFVACGWLMPWLQSPLPPSRRRQTVCVVQLVGLALVIVPAVPASVSAPIALVVLGALCYSFGVDVLWLSRARLALPSGTELEYR